MAEQVANSDPIPSHEFSDHLIAPRLCLSSLGAGWDGLLAEAFSEPAELDGWLIPASSDINLILLTGGPLHMEQRLINGSWKTLNVSEGELILRPGVGVPYEVRWKSLSTTPTQTLHLHLNQTLFFRIAEEVANCDPTQVTLVGRSGFQDPLLTQIGLALWRELQQNSPAGNLYAQTAAQMLAVHLLRRYSSINTSPALDIKSPSQGLTPRQVKRVTEFILAHLNQSLSLENLATQVGFSSYHFARLFRQTLQESPHQFVLRLRIEQAQRLLKDTDMPVADIALASGFANQSHLTRSFKRHLGLTPRAYRRQS